MVQFKQISNRSVLSLDRLDMGVFIPPYKGQVHGDKALMGGLMKGDIDPMGGLVLTLID